MKELTVYKKDVFRLIYSEKRLSFEELLEKDGCLSSS